MNPEEILTLLRHQRHDFGNHLQVIGGYLEMGMAGRAREYLQEIYRQFDEERRIFAVQPPELALLLYQQFLKAREHGLDMRLGEARTGNLPEAEMKKIEAGLETAWDEIACEAGEGAAVTININTTPREINLKLAPAENAEFASREITIKR